MQINVMSRKGANHTGSTVPTQAGRAACRVGHGGNRARRRSAATQGHGLLIRAPDEGCSHSAQAKKSATGGVALNSNHQRRMEER